MAETDEGAAVEAAETEELTLTDDGQVADEQVTDESTEETVEETSETDEQTEQKTDDDKQNAEKKIEQLGYQVSGLNKKLDALVDAQQKKPKEPDALDKIASDDLTDDVTRKMVTELQTERQERLRLEQQLADTNRQIGELSTAQARAKWDADMQAKGLDGLVGKYDETVQRVEAEFKEKGYDQIADPAGRNAAWTEMANRIAGETEHNATPAKKEPAKPKTKPDKDTKGSQTSKSGGAPGNAGSTSELSDDELSMNLTSSVTD